MKKTLLFTTTAGFGLVAMLATPAFAQTPASETADSSAIVVTGSRIVRPNVDSSIPITSVGADELTQTGQVSLGDTLNKLPALRSTYSQANSTRFIGTSGLNLLDLRGLGTSRTLVLVNGRRHVTSQPGVNSVDVNTIPTDLVDRVDVVTGGNSAVYGSDAVAGVVNFITKRDFEGLSARAQGGISSRGDRESYFASITAGKNFNDGRGNVAVSLEYAKSTTLYFTDRDAQTGAISGRYQFNGFDNTIGEAATGDGIPDSVFFNGRIRNNNISEGGLYTSTCPADSPATAARRAVNCTGLKSNTGADLGKTFLFDDSGNLIANPIEFDFRVFGSSNSIGGLGSTLRLTGMLQPGLERKAANVLSSYEFNETVRGFVEAKYVQITANQEGQPTFHNNSFSIDNPYLTAASRALLVSSLAPGATTFTAQRFNVDFGGRGELHERELFRIVGGIDGTFNDDWRYEVSLNYGRLETFYRTEGNIDNAKYAKSINAVRNTAGQIVCGVNADAITTNDDAGCVPVNLFGNGKASQAALAYFLVDSTRDQSANQMVASAYVNGDLSQLFELPAGPISFAIGGEHRQEDAYSIYDEFTRNGNTFLNAIGTFDPPTLKVSEAFGEVRAPLLADMRFVKELTLEGSGRFSKYNNKTGSVFAYNFGGTYAPFEDIRFRVNYGKSVRAPTQSDLYASASQTFLNGLSDPCSQTNINNNPNRATNCAAAGVPTKETLSDGTVVPWTNVPASGIYGFNGGNANVTEETGKGLTAGFVFTPSFIDGLTISADYYEIEVSSVIFSLGGQTLINQCYDSPSGINNPYCTAVFRRPDGTFAGQSNRIVGGQTVSFATTGPSFQSGPFNFARLETSGIDMELNYTHLFDNGIRFDLRTIASYLIKRNQYTDINQPNYQDRLKAELGDPEWAGSMTLGLDFGKFDVDWTMRYIGKQLITAYETAYPLQGRPATNPDALPFFWYPDKLYHNVRIGAEVTKSFNVYVGVDNLTDELPPYDLLGTAGGDPFDNVGRFFYAGVKANF